MTFSRIEKQADQIDLACEQEQRFTEGSINAARSRAKRKQEPRADGTYAIVDCTDCGAEIGQGRLDAAPNNTVCLDCASAAERGHRRWSR